MALSFKNVRDFGLLGMTFIIVSTGAISFLSTTQIVQGLSGTLQTERPKLDLAESVRRRFLNAREIFDAFTLGEEKDTGAAVALMDQTVKECETLKKLIPEEKIEPFIAAAKRFRLAIVTYAEESRTDPAGSRAIEMERIAGAAATEAAKLSEELVSEARAKIAEANRIVTDIAIHSQRTSILGMLMGILAGFLVALFMQRGLSLPIQKLIAGTRRIAGGDLSYRFKKESSDEIGQLAEAFNKMLEDLSASFQKERELAEARKKAEELLKESDRRFFDLFYSSKEAILLIRGNKSIDANEAAARMLGYSTRAEFLEKHLEELSPPTQPDGRDSLEKAEEVMRVAFEKGFNQFEWMYRGAGGEDLPVQVSLTSVMLWGEQVLYCVWTDLTKQKQHEQEALESQHILEKQALELASALEESHKSREILSSMLDDNNQMRTKFEQTARKLGLILASTTEGIFGLDKDGKNTFVNARTLKLLGYEEAELLGKNGHALWHHSRPDGTPYPTHECPNTLVLQDGKPRSGEEYYWRKDGTGFPMEFSAVPLMEDGTYAGSVVSFHDITERKLYAEAENAKIAAELANRAKSQFLAAMSHEIRTPLNAVIGFADILSKTPLNEEQKKYINTMSASGRVLLNLINDILDFSKIEAGKITLEEIDFDLEYLIKDVFKIVSSRIEETAITPYVDFDKDIPTRFKGDPTRMRQILINLLNNAVKFTDRGEIGLIVRPSGETTLPDEVGILMTVKDTGIGISKNKMELLFQPFSQVDMSTTRKYGGTGLGLSICRPLIERMGGRIWVESEENAGSEFKFTIKLKKGATLADSKMVLLTKEKLAGKKILIVEDNKASQEILGIYCRDMGLSVLFVASSAKEAIEHIRGLAGTGTYPDMILSDIRMADMDGYQLVEKLNVLFPGSGMKFVAITSDIWFAASAELENRGFHGFVTKPIIKSDLAGVIRAAFGDERTGKKIVTRHTAQELACKDMRILVVEDAKTNRDLVTIILTQWGCWVDFAENGKEAVEKLRANKYDVCLMDLQMPVMGGLEAVQIIRREISKDLPVIALTAAVTDDVRIECLNNGMTDYIVKPMNVDELKAKVIKHGRSHG